MVVICVDSVVSFEKEDAQKFKLVILKVGGQIGIYGASQIIEGTIIFSIYNHNDISIKMLFKKIYNTFQLFPSVHIEVKISKLFTILIIRSSRN